MPVRGNPVSSLQSPKWEAWKNIVQVPASLEKEGISEAEYFGAKNSWASSVFDRFLIGSVLNIFIGFVAYHVGRNIQKLPAKIALGLLIFSLLVYGRAEREELCKWLKARREGVKKLCEKLK